jgi:hypothetical protein
MGTRSVTIVMEENQELCRIYRQYDGYPKGHGLELLQFCDRKNHQRNKSRTRHTLHHI